MIDHPCQHGLLTSLPLFLALLAAYAADPDCTVGGATVRADADRAVAACTTARARYAELFGRTAPRIHIVLHDLPGYEVASSGETGLVFWPISSALVPVGGVTAPRQWIDRQWEEVLPHEVMHALTMASFYADTDAVGHGGYGTPLPDWFEEGIAIWAEPPESRHGRVAQARGLPSHRLDLLTILRGEHPAAAQPDIIAAKPGARVPADEALRAFYPQAIAVLSFIHEAGGAPALRELARRLVRDPTDDRALLGLPGLPTDTPDLLAAWAQWLAAQ
jgi:hypothetical protein